MNKKVCLVSLGCPKNLVDAEMMLGFLKDDGFEITTRVSDAEVILVNTCAFVEDSKKESIERIFEMAEYKQKGSCEALVVSGCLAQRYSENLKEEMPEVDLLVGTGEFNRLGKLLKEHFILSQNDQKLLKKSAEVAVSSKQILPDPDLPRILSTPSHYSYLKVSEGCSHRCSFCIIPHIRGGLKSRTVGSISAEVEQLVRLGVKEFNVIAQDLNEYGKDLRDGTNLAALLSHLDRLDGDFWLRLHYLYPLEFTDRLIAVLADARHIVPYIDMPLQHISEKILRSMKRGSPGRYVRQVLSKLKNAISDVAIRTTFIVGYPGETEQDFLELYHFVAEYGFDHVGVFQYSQEEGTSAAELPDQVDAEIKQERYARLMQLQQQVSLKRNHARLGRNFRVLVEGPSNLQIGKTQARTSFQSPEIDGVTYLEGLEYPSGEFLWVKINNAEAYDLIAEPC